MPSKSTPPPLSELPHQATRWLLVWLAALVLGALVLVGAMRAVAVQHLKHDAGDAAVQAAQVIAAAVSGIDELVAGGVVDAGSRAQILRLMSAGGAYKLRLFDRDGQLRFDSDQTTVAAGHVSDPGHSTSAAEIAAVAATGRIKVDVETGQAPKPELYSEAYVPLVRDGRAIGVAEVYVDQRMHREHMLASQLKVASAAALVLLLLGLVGVAQWRRRTWLQQRAAAQMQYLARHDPLSGALNRTSFAEVLRLAAGRHAVDGGGFAVLCLDLARFKEVNDAHGHSAGDEVLRQLTARLLLLVRHGDELARLDGDEFAILQGGVGHVDDVGTLARRVLASVEQPFDVGGLKVHCQASVGAAIFGVDADRSEDLLNKADLALQRARAMGAGTFNFYDASLDARLQQRRELSRALRQAVADESLTLHYQRLVAADGRTVLGHEALLRWTHPARGPVSPAEFIPLAEEGGMIEPLGEWVLRRACADAAAWPEDLSVSVNLSALQFRGGHLAATVAKALAASGLRPHRLELEITESVLLNNADDVLATLAQLRALGVRIAMDDFGTGFSSLAYLWRFPFDKVKIDRAFTRDIVNDPKADMIVRSIIMLAHSLKIRVNAEGVETAAQMERLQHHGCDELQGFLLGRPVPLVALPGPAATPERVRPAVATA